MLDSCDVLIVGGGPAGSSCARGLGRAGFDVVVLDKSTFPRDKVCAGWITPQVIDALQLDLDDYARGRVLQPIHGFRTSILGGREIETRFNSVVSYGIRRCEFDHYLLQRTPARKHLGDRFESLRRDGTDWIVNDRFRARVVIGAGGNFCPVARILREGQAVAQPLITAQEAEFPLSAKEAQGCRIDPGVPELSFYPDLRGYAWCFRKGDYLNVGAGREGETHLAACLEQFQADLEHRDRFHPTSTLRYRGHAYRLYQGSTPYSRQPGILLVGDSLGLASSESGEGIRPAVESGLIAARVIATSRANAYSDLSQQFERELSARMGPSPRIAASGATATIRRMLGRKLLSIPWFVRRVVLRHWFLHQRQPALAMDW